MNLLRTAAGVISAAPFVLVFACSKSGTDSSSTSVSSAASSAAASGTASETAAAAPAIPLSLTPSANMSIPERFTSEAMHRPVGPCVRVEETTAAFRKAGFDLIEEKQHLASPYMAKYCVGAKTKNEEISFSICEYDSDGKATEGAAMNDKAFKNVKNRHTHRNGATTLTVLESTKNDANDALVKKLVDTFQAQKPTAAPGGAPAANASGGSSAAPSAAASK